MFNREKRRLERPLSKEMKAKIHSINLSKSKGVSKAPVPCVKLIENYGLDGDAHAGDGIRQVSLLSFEAIMRRKGRGKTENAARDLKPGDFAENITTEGIDLPALKIGDRLRLGQNAVVEISKIGKDCHKYCAIYYQIGDCIMPREGIFARVIKGAEIAVGDEIEAVENV